MSTTGIPEALPGFFEAPNARIAPTPSRAQRTDRYRRPADPGFWETRTIEWLREEALPFWFEHGLDQERGGFHEALGFDGRSLRKPKRMRTMARQIYAFSIAGIFGWHAEAAQCVAEGIRFIQRGRTPRGGWVRVFNPDGRVADPTEDAYDHACVLLALAHAHRMGNPEALPLACETFAFIDEHLADPLGAGFLETAEGGEPRRANPHMHMLEAFLAWHEATGDRRYLKRAREIADLFRLHFFDGETWTLGEYFTRNWSRPADAVGEWTEPGHHFEWAALLVEYAHRSGDTDFFSYARKLYASAIANGLNRLTGLAFGAVSREGLPLDQVSRSWPQTEAVKAAIALSRTKGPDMEPEIEDRMAHLFRWHIDPAPRGLWIDRYDEKGRMIATEVPASIFYHLMTAFTAYLDRNRWKAMSDWPAARGSG